MNHRGSNINEVERRAPRMILKELTMSRKRWQKIFFISVDLNAKTRIRREEQKQFIIILGNIPY